MYNDFRCLHIAICVSLSLWPFFYIPSSRHQCKYKTALILFLQCSTFCFSVNSNIRIVAQPHSYFGMRIKVLRTASVIVDFDNFIIYIFKFPVHKKDKKEKILFQIFTSYVTGSISRTRLQNDVKTLKRRHNNVFWTSCAG